jgi:hypothetical protein
MEVEDEVERLRKKFNSDADDIIKNVSWCGFTKEEFLDALPFIFVKLCREMDREYSFELRTFLKMTKDARKWLREKGGEEK